MAEDIAQEALTALVQRWRRAGPPQSPEAFVFAIARRRANRANARRVLLAPIDALRDIAGREAGPEQLHQQRSDLAIVLSAIRRLRKADREVLLLRLAGELELDAIATLMHTTPAAAKMRLHRARHRLSALLPETEHGRRKQTA
jgi:RNA polymerase sigma-70 factor (ECF subfamily)